MNSDASAELLHQLDSYVPAVSMATGHNVLAQLACFVIWCCAAWSAAAPEVAHVLATWDSAYVSSTVTSHANGLPLSHGKSVVPSGRLLSSIVMLTGSFVADVCARLMARQTISFVWLWRCCL